MDLTLLVFTCAVNLILGTIILSRDTRRTHARLFFVMSVAITSWIVTNYMTNHYLGSVQLVETSNRLAFLFGYSVVVSGLIFTYYFPVVRKVKITEYVPLSLLIVITGILSVTSLVAGHVTISEVDNSITFASGPLVVVYLVSFLTIVLMITRNLTTLPTNVTTRSRQQARIVLMAFVFSALAGLSLNLILPLLTGDNWQITRLGPLATVVLVTLTAYAIIRHGLFDIRLAVIRTVGYLMTLATLSFVYFLIAYLFSVIVFEESVNTGFSASPINIALALVLAFIFQPIKQFFDRITDKIFFRDRYSTDEFYSRFSNILTSTTDLRLLLQSSAIEIGSTLKAEQTFFYVRYNHSHHISAGTSKHDDFNAEEIKLFDRAVDNSIGKEVFVRELIAETDRDLYRVMKKRRLAILMPIASGSSPIAYLALGDQKGKGYTERDIQVLETISDELLIAIQNSLSVQEVRELNVNLQERINLAVKELKASNSKLVKLDETKDEFISMASHQLRTPLTSVKGYISMVLDGDVGDISKEQRVLLEQAFESSQRMVYLIGDFLNISRLRTGKFVLEPSEVNLGRIVNDEIAQLRDTAKARGINLVLEKPETLPTITADDNKIRQVMMNFMDNAIYYTLAGGTISVKLYKDVDNLVFKVYDNGIGVPKSEQMHLFTKFFRAGNAKKQRPDGTGIGLYMAKKVVVAHGGVVLFESREGKGSMFGFRIPIKQDMKRFDQT